ncbi:MAG: hypothetical protein GPJ51_06560 [Candidatus Heimdallarchaeota archaeon]|nr:hypothetical protein [Candidatus Heimdallarchaeota archaeon]
MTLVYSNEIIFKLRSCDECKNRLVLNSSNLVCSECGLIHDQIYCREYRCLIDFQHQTHLAEPNQTYFIPDNKDTFRRKRLGHREVKGSGLDHLAKKMYHVFSYLELPNRTKLRTIFLIKQNYKKENVDSTQLAIASMIQAIKEHKLLITDSKILATFKEFNMRINSNSALASRRKLNYKARLNVTDFLKQFLSMLHKQKPELENRAKECFELAKLKRKYQGNNPRVFASAIIFIVYRDQKLNEDKKIKQIYLSKLFEVAPFSLRATKEIILQELGQC